MSEQRTRLDRHGMAYLWSYITSHLSGKADRSDVPTRLSQLTNDSGYITDDDVPAPDLSQAQGVLPIANGGTGGAHHWPARENLRAHGYKYIDIDALYDQGARSDIHVFSLLQEIVVRTHDSAAIVLDDYVTSVLTKGNASAEFLGTVQRGVYNPAGQIVIYRFWGVLTATNTFVYWRTRLENYITWTCTEYTVINTGGNGQTGTLDARVTALEARVSALDGQTTNNTPDTSGE